MMAGVRLEGVCCRYAGREALADVSAEIAAGELVVCVGPSGCGKSTLLRVIAGLEPLGGGHIYIGGECVNDVAPEARGVAMVFQSYALYPHMSARENLGIGLRVAGVAKDEVARRVDEVAAMLRIGELLERRPGELSGGQCQRVAIGRAIVRAPRVYLLDEPLSNLDAGLRTQLRRELGGLHRRLGATMVYVTHDQAEAMQLADRVVVMEGGRVRQIDSPAGIYRRPGDLFVARFFGGAQMNVLAVEGRRQGGEIVVSAPSLDPFALAVGAGGDVRDGRMRLGIRPEHIRLGEAGEIVLAAQVARVESLGGTALAYMEVDGLGEICVEGRGDGMAAEGSRLSLSLMRRDCHLFDGEGRRIGLLGEG